jgi:transposase-like protein
MSTTRSERISLSPSDRASRDRRIARAIKSGVNIHDVRRRFGIGEHAIREACREYGVTIPKGGNRL